MVGSRSRRAAFVAKVVGLFLLTEQAWSLSLRRGDGASAASGSTREGKAAPPGKKERCAELKSLKSQPAPALLEKESLLKGNSFAFSHCAELSDVKELATRPTGQGAKLTPDECHRYCMPQKESFYFLIRKGNECVCAKDYEQDGYGVPLCNTPCAGDSKQFCGGDTSWGVYIMAEAGCDTKVGKPVPAKGVNRHLEEAKDTMNVGF